MSTEKPVNITIYKENKESIDSSSNRTEAYIILANEELNNKNRYLIKENSELTAEKDSLEEDNDKLEKSSTYQRGLLHNLSELNKLEEIVSKNENELNKVFLEEMKYLDENFKLKEKNISIFVGLVTTLLLIESLMGIIDIQSLVSFFITLISVYMSDKFNLITLNHISDKNFKEQRKLIETIIENKKNEINKIKSSSDFLGDYIDTI
jgi:hypothetical protein|uniref:Uncharacterized protein n=1 Tax=Mimiviridae sp. ChoanoV1 TaxID=2596887 RepID=A0A5B8IGK6_9VIRU|nr:hypothetical protein 6_9 [Mimiviridae sp. ChoanoV1]